MNIKYGDDNFYTRYLKRFLNSEILQNTKVLGAFDRTDKHLLVEYLNLPNVKNMFDVSKNIVKSFPELKSLFNEKLSDDNIEYTSKVIDKDTAQWLIDNLNKIHTYCQSVGWKVTKVSEWIDLNKDINNDGIIDIKDRDILSHIIYDDKVYNNSIMKKADLNLDGVINTEDLDIFNDYYANGKLKLTISKENRRNYFPNKDMLVFINQFEGDFLYNYALRDNSVGGMDDFPHPNTDQLLKLALYHCKPGQKLTIAHNNSKSQHLVIGCSPATLKSDITNLMAQNVVEVDLGRGQSYQYTCPSIENGDSVDGHWLLIQCASNYSSISGTTTKTITLEVGDINFDGKIDLQDYTMLANYTAEGDNADKLHWKATKKQLAVMDINKDGVINTDDAILLSKFINKESTTPSLGTVQYTYETETDTNINNVSNFLIIDGHYDDNINIPFGDFVNDSWIIHEKFFNYLLNMSITPYTNADDITYLQQLLKQYYPQYSLQRDYFYPGRFDTNMKNLIKKYQLSQADYTLGDLNKDNKLDKVDLQLLRHYLDKMYGDIDSDGNVNNTDKELLRNYLQNNLKELSEPEINKCKEFINKYGKENALDIMQEFIDNTTYDLSATQKIRADVNQDGRIDEDDYTFLKNQIDTNGDLLKDYNISFMLGYCDVQTEALLEMDYNSDGRISEVTK